MREILYGRHAVCESLLAGRRKHHKVLLAKGVRRSDVIDQIVSLARQANIPVIDTQRDHLDKIGNINHQGVALETDAYPYVTLLDMLPDSPAHARESAPFFLLLDLLQDPQNVGSLLRTAEAVRVTGVVIQRRRAVDITPTVVHTSAGAAEHLPIAQVTNLVKAIRDLKALDVWVAGLEATPDAQRYEQADLRGPLAIVLGSEGEGLRRLVRETCDFLLRLPMLGKITSLNASVAGSVILYEVLRQRQHGSSPQE
ncbi:MAG TPA: 23S rRNA (guanosine(2251)-2'-O)-methyltransferase RlmB [Chloroflexi bacterium]|nr:23S rRNA (guanosine(2251)-2'-O)-methyltransferase RlmB [Chloroflexota bacterium]